ncbi:MAG: hypothetical protein L3J08_06485 [Flavobacteriaceae bacterium]|nr:hypothetical protein [Flavobacteriaceae bacterium]
MRHRFEKLSLTKMVIVSAILFFIIVVLIDFFIALTKFSFDNVLLNMATTTYIIRKLAIAIVYGLIIGFIYKRKQKKAAKL